MIVCQGINDGLIYYCIYCSEKITFVLNVIKLRLVFLIVIFVLKKDVFPNNYNKYLFIMMLYL